MDINLQIQKKLVTFSLYISIIDVESWKKYNEDVSDDIKYMRLKREIQYLKAHKNIGRPYEKNEDCCNIY